MKSSVSSFIRSSRVRTAHPFEHVMLGGPSVEVKTINSRITNVSVAETVEPTLGIARTPVSRGVLHLTLVPVSFTSRRVSYRTTSSRWMVVGL